MLKSFALFAAVIVLTHAVTPGLAQTDPNTSASHQDPSSNSAEVPRPTQTAQSPAVSHQDSSGTPVVPRKQIQTVPGTSGIRQDAGSTTPEGRKSFAPARSNASPQTANPAGSVPQCPDGPCNYPQAQIRVVEPPPQPAPWSRHDRILWAADLVLAILGYVGIVVAIGTLKTIKRQIESVETIAQAAVESASAATAIGREMMSAQRPWILMTVVRSQEMAESFNIMATNCGRTPAEIIDCPDRVNLVLNEQQLPKNRGNAIKGFGVLSVPIMLLPGESTVIQRFGRDDLKWVCKTDESLRKVERKEETVFIYGSVMYREPAISDMERTHKTDWCCKYIHGETTSNLVIDGPPEYNKHT